MDVLVSTGEQVTIALLSMALQKLGVNARSYTGSQIPLRTDNSYSKARIEEIDDKKMRADLDGGQHRGRGRFSRAWMPTATSPPWAVAAPTPLPWRWPPRCRPTSARSTPMWMASTPPTPEW